MMKLAAILVAASVLVAPKPVELTLNVSDGDVVSSVKTVRVTVKAEDPITQVEFYVGDELRDTDSSTPYEFKIDPLVEPEGPIELAFAAYTTEGDNAKKSVKLTIDTGVSKGADVHVQAGIAALQDAKWDDAILSARIALKAKENYNPARMVMARAYLGKGVLDTAQKYAEDVATEEPNNREALELLSGINLRRAFNTFNRGGDRDQTLASIDQALKAAISTRKKSLEAQLDALGEPNDANIIRYADLAIKSGRYRMASNALTPFFQKDDRRAEIANRLAYAQMRDGRFQEAIVTLNQHGRSTTMTAYGLALDGVLWALQSESEKSELAMKEAILSDSQDLGVQLSQAYLALRDQKVDVLNKLVVDLARNASPRPEVNYYLAVLYEMAKQYDKSTQSFETAVLAEPMAYDVYIAKANQALRQAQKEKDAKEVEFQYKRAKLYFEAALEAKPESPEALTGMSIMFGLQKKTRDSILYADAAAKAGPNYAAGFYARSAALVTYEGELRSLAGKQEQDGLRSDALATLKQASDINRQAFVCKETAGKLDRKQLAGLAANPDMVEAFDYFERYGRMPLISAP